MTYGKETNWDIHFNKNSGDDVFRSMTGNRKRSRDDESCEFMPLSKRINNLHINNNLSSSSANSISQSSQQNGFSEESSSDSIGRPTYDPGVNSSQSPYYYDNKLLFELHMERVQRTGQQYPF